jgi:hypothetical protein
VLLPPDAAPGIYLLWIPLGAGGSGLVRFNGRVYEWLLAHRQRRRPQPIYHTALVVRTATGDHVVETMWPSPSGDPVTRGVVVQAPVFGGWLGRFRVFRYEVRSWHDGVLPDADQAVGGPQLVAAEAERLLGLVGSVPPLIWGRDQRRVGEMWNSNSVISWLLVNCGLDLTGVVAPAGGRAPGWNAGIRIARADLPVTG